LPDRVLLGAVIGAHGIAGEVKVKTFTALPENLDAYGALSTEDGRKLAIAALRPVKDGEALVRFEGVLTRDAAESLKGQGLYVARSALPPPEAGEYYLADLIGLRIEDKDGKTLGTVLALHNFGAGDMIEMQDAGGETSFIPFTDACVPVVDIAGGRILADLPHEDGARDDGDGQ
jgi:16S rRNA processing protein RimM